MRVAGESADFTAELRQRLNLPDTIALHARPIDDAIVAQHAARLPPQLANAVAKRQREFLAGRLCAAAALTQAGYARSPWLPMNADRLPMWPAGWVGSISHSAEAALAVIARDTAWRGLGVDIELPIATTQAEGITSMIALPGELALLAELPPALRLTLLFCAKEALYKALYPQVRQFFDFGAARLIELMPMTLRLCLTVNWNNQWPLGTQVPVRFAFCQGHVVTMVTLPGNAAMV